VFKSIRFAAPPTRNLRWEKPAPPTVQIGILDGSYGFICTQSLSFALNQNGSQPAGSSPSLLLLSSLSAGNQSEGKTFNMFNVSERLNLLTVIDCLFLDVYVPSKALRPGAPKLPVIVWVYGGG
jgi:carboxylesterase type B